MMQRQTTRLAHWHQGTWASRIWSPINNSQSAAADFNHLWAQIARKMSGKYSSEDTSGCRQWGQAWNIQSQMRWTLMSAVIYQRQLLTHVLLIGLAVSELTGRASRAQVARCLHGAETIQYIWFPSAEWVSARLKIMNDKYKMKQDADLPL